MADLQQLFQLGQQVQGRLQQLQTELADRTVEAGAGGGLVRVTVDGRGLVRSITIDRRLSKAAMRSCCRPVLAAVAGPSARRGHAQAAI
jgi:DNA-binding protein YbaB